MDSICKKLKLKESNLIDHLSFKESYHYMLTLDKEITAYNEGLFSAAGTAIKTSYRGAKNGVQLAKGSVRLAYKKVIELTKKLIKGFYNMLAKGAMTLVQATNRLKSLPPKLSTLKQKLNDFDQEVVKNITFNMITKETMDRAGWNLKGGSSWTDDPQKAAFTSTFRDFFFYYTFMKDGHTPDDAIGNVTNSETLFKGLDGMLNKALEMYGENPHMKEISKWDRGFSRLYGTFHKPTNGYKYRLAKDPKEFGRFVAQTYSPAGFIANTGKDVSKDLGFGRVDDFKQRITPLTAKNIPSDAIAEVIDTNIKYIDALVKYIIDLNIPQVIKDRREKIERIEKVVDKLAKMEDVDIDREQNKGGDNSTDKGSVDYNELKNGKSEAFIFDQIVTELQSYGEYSDGDHSSDLSNAQKAQNDGNTEFKPTENKQSRANTNDQSGLNIDKGDVTTEMVEYGLPYLQAFLTYSGNLLFTEIKMYGYISTVITNQTLAMIETCEKSVFVKSAKEVDKSEKNTRVANTTENPDDKKDKEKKQSSAQSFEMLFEGDPYSEDLEEWVDKTKNAVKATGRGLKNVFKTGVKAGSNTIKFTGKTLKSLRDHILGNLDDANSPISAEQAEKIIKDHKNNTSDVSAMIGYMNMVYSTLDDGIIKVLNNNGDITIFGDDVYDKCDKIMANISQKLEENNKRFKESGWEELTSIQKRVFKNAFRFSKYINIYTSKYVDIKTDTDNSYDATEEEKNSPDYIKQYKVTGKQDMKYSEVILNKRKKNLSLSIKRLLNSNENRHKRLAKEIHTYINNNVKKLEADIYKALNQRFK